MAKKKVTQTAEELKKLQDESEKQALPEQKRVFSVSEKIRRRVHHLPDPARMPLGYDEHKAFDRVFPYIRLPRLHPPNHGDTVIFNAQELHANQLFLGDNLEVLRTLSSESIDLIYIDPPFFSGRNYNVIWGDSNEVRSFHDIWEGGIDSYLIWLNARLWEMRRVLKKTGSIYVHCDWHASHYIKTEMDKIFGYESFRNEITWQRTNAHNDPQRYGNIHDVIFFYSKTDEWVWNSPKTEYEEWYVERYYRYIDSDGKRFLSRDITAPAHGSNSGQYTWKGKKPPPGRMWAFTKNKMEELDKRGKLFYTTNGIPRLKQFLDEMEGAPVQDTWTDILPLVSWSDEGMGYPTQKPEALLERIIKASSNEGDVVADFFCGGGTTLSVAMKLKRHFIGCDSSRVAVAVTMDRLVKIGEELSGVKSNISAKDEVFQLKLQAEGATEKVPNINVSYLGVYPVDKFKHLPQEDFINFVLTCYGASRNARLSSARTERAYSCMSRESGGFRGCKACKRFF